LLGEHTECDGDSILCYGTYHTECEEDSSFSFVTALLSCIIPLFYPDLGFLLSPELGLLLSRRDQGWQTGSTFSSLLLRHHHTATLHCTVHGPWTLPTLGTLIGTSRFSCLYLPRPRMDMAESSNRKLFHVRKKRLRVHQSCITSSHLKRWYLSSGPPS
jgi:hypothetical protein